MSTHDIDIEPLDEPTPSDIEPLDDMRDLLPSVEATDTTPAALTEAVAPPTPLPIVEVLGADFPLPALTRWVPDLAKKQRLDQAVVYAKTVDVTTETGMEVADAALATIRAEVKAVEADFEEPKRLANELHKSITGRLADWLMDAKVCIETVGRAMAQERRRRDEASAIERRKAQDAADALARETARKAADAAKANGAPAPVVEQMKQQAAVATAPPVPVAATAPAPLRHSTVTKTWKARIVGTPADAAPNPSMAELTPAQQAEIRKLMAEVVAGRQPMTRFEINWSPLNASAKAEKSTMAVPGIEAYEELSTRAKAGRRV